MISQTRWCSPLLSTPPIYIDGRLRTGSNPSRTVMSLAVYVAVVIGVRLNGARPRRQRQLDGYSADGTSDGCEDGEPDRSATFWPSKRPLIFRKKYHKLLSN